MINIAEVIVDIANSEVDKVFDYIIPSNLIVSEGVKVLVPFGNRFIDGYVVLIKNFSEYDFEKLKEIKSVKDDYVISPELIQMCHYLKSNFYLKLIDCIRLCLPTVIRQEKVKHITKTTVTITSDENLILTVKNNLRKNAKNQIALLEYLIEKKSEDLVLLNNKFGSIAVKKLFEDNVITKQDYVKMRDPLAGVVEKDKRVVLTKGQEEAIAEIKKTTNMPVLLHGVTGSGKTEIYLNVIEDAVFNNNKTAIMLVPEISLTPQMVSRFKSRFGNQIAVLHSGLSQGEKFDEWVRIYNKEAKIVIGARSAIFAPLKDLGVVIIDEEHDSSYVSDSNPRYNTQDVAWFRAKFNDCPLVLGSATPDIENYYLAKNNKMKLIELPTRVNNKPMPQVQIVDMLPEFRGGNTTQFSSVLVNEMQSVINENKQSILFVNRRGFASSVICRDCSYVPMCEHCDVALSYHKQDHQLKCHYCGKRYKMLDRCPTCGGDHLKMGGVGTQRVVSDLKEMFPDVPVFRMDNDTTSTKDAHNKILSEFANTQPAILVGTQMIAKGHDFPLVTLVGVLDADLSLYFGQYRASEKTFQLITQVAGRAGRDKHEGKVVLQTYYPKHYVYNLVANYNYKGFYEKEINLRDVTNFPPYSKVLRILVTSGKDDFAKSTTNDCFMALKDLRKSNLKDFIFLEAMRSPIGKIKDKHRYQIVARIKNNEEIVSKIFEICDTLKNKNVTIFIEINPQSLS